MSNTALLGSYGDNSGAGLMFRNRIINGDMRIDQRNSGAAVTVPTAGSVFPVDRFKVERANGYVNTATAQQIADGPTGFTRSLRYTAGTAETPTGSLYSTIQQAIEGFNFADLGWGSAGASSATLSFWVKISITGTFGIILRSADATLSYATTFSYSSANTWQYVTLNIPGPTTGGTTAFTVTNGVGVTVFWELGTGPTLSTAASSSWQSVNALGVTGSTKLNSTSGATYQITGVQLEAGPTATPFERRPIGTELALCQRYFLKQNVPVFQNCVYFSGAFQNIGSTQTVFPTVMRDIPTVAVSYTNDDNTASVAISGLNNSRTAQGIRYAFTVSNLVFPYAGFLITSAVSAEL